MTSTADPVWWVLFWALAFAFGVWVLSGRLVAALVWLDRRNVEHDHLAAADHGEPTREQVEWDNHVGEAIELTQADIDAIIAWDELEFAASVMADIDDLPDGAA